MLACVVAFVFEVTLPSGAQRSLFLEFGFVPARWTALLDREVDPRLFVTPLTSLFMHAGLLHIVGNMLFLRVFGDSAEGRLGHVRLFVLYVVSGLLATATQWVADPASMQPVVGASGAIAGVMAASVVLAPRARVSIVVPLVIFFPVVELPAFVLVAFWFGLQFFSGVMTLGIGEHSGVAYWAHVGGFASGLLMTLLLQRATRTPVPPRARSVSPWLERTDDGRSRV